MYTVNNEYTGVCMYIGTLEECYEYIQINSINNYIDLD